jgi:hypothetical protein
VAVLALSAQSATPVERFSATALSRTDSTVRTLVEIDIQRWSDDAEGEQLAAAFRRSGVDAALEELKRHPPAGQLRSINGLSRAIRYAREITSTGGARYFLLLTDPFTARDLFQGAGTSNGTLSAISIWLGQLGNGEGQIADGTKIGIDTFGAVTVDVRDPPVVLPVIDRPTR